MYTRNELLANINIEDEMQRSYIDYSMSVIIGRALPDVRDGLKPVHRRVLFAMHELGNSYNRAYKKSARVVGAIDRRDAGCRTIPGLARATRREREARAQTSGAAPQAELVGQTVDEVQGRPTACERSDERAPQAGSLDDSQRGEGRAGVDLDQVRGAGAMGRGVECGGSTSGQRGG